MSLGDWLAKRAAMREHRYKTYGPEHTPVSRSTVHQYTPLREESPGRYSVESREITQEANTMRFQDDLMKIISDYRTNGQGNQIYLDFSKVRMMDTSGAAVCINGIKAAQKRKLELKFIGLSNHVVDRIVNLRLETLFGLERKKPTSQASDYSI